MESEIIPTPPEKRSYFVRIRRNATSNKKGEGGGFYNSERDVRSICYQTTITNAQR